MKTILCYGDSNLRGTIPGPSLDAAGLIKLKYSKDKRWTGILQKKLGAEYDIVEEGIGGRTTTLDEIEPGRPYRNGLKDLPFCLESHYPIDLVIFLLGINDTQHVYHRMATQIGEGMRQLVRSVLCSNKGPNIKAPKVLIIAPQPIINIPHLHPQFVGESIEKSKALAKIYHQVSQEENCEFLDAAPLITSSEKDGIHLDESSCLILGHAVFEKVKQIFA
jgi:lysophospholipase L1-like esterase